MSVSVWAKMIYHRKYLLGILVSIQDLRFETRYSVPEQPSWPFSLTLYKITTNKRDRSNHLNICQNQPND